MDSRAAEMELLDLGTLHRETELHRKVVDALALAASVTLERVRGEGVADPALADFGGGIEAAYSLTRVGLDDGARLAFGDADEATEWGAAGVAVGIVHRLLRRRVFCRLPKGTGADYLMRSSDVLAGDAFERLEVTGISRGDETAGTRLREKVRRLALHPDAGVGWAVVTRFHGATVEVRGERWPQ